jgi:hypothetical protein
MTGAPHLRGQPVLRDRQWDPIWVALAEAGVPRGGVGSFDEFADLGVRRASKICAAVPNVDAGVSSVTR